jgi:hypothetical protein
MTPPVTRPPRGRLIVGALVGVLLAIAGLASPAMADSFDPQRRDAEARAAQADQAAQAIAASIAGLTDQLTQAQLALQATQERLPIAQAELATAQQTVEQSQREALLIAERLQDAQAQEASITATIATVAARTVEVHTAVGQMARQAYQGQMAATPLSVALGAGSPQDFVNASVMVATALRVQTATLDLLQQANASNRNSQARLTAVKDEVAALKVEADQKLVEANAARADAAARQLEIQNLIADQTTKQAAVAAMKAQAEAAQAQIEAQQAIIAAELASIIAKQRAAQAATAICTAPGGGATSAPGPGGSLPSSIGPFRGVQLINAAQIIIAANDLGIDTKGQAIGVMTAIGESTLTNINYGDAAGPDSRGLFQQRANGAWGSLADRMNPRIAATNFFKALLRVPGWESMPPTLAAHATQNNADPYYYAQYWNDAVLIVSTLSGVRCG